MLQFNSPVTELTTAATDAVLGLLCLLLIAWVRKFRAIPLWKTGLWSWVFGLLALSSFLGAIAHGFILSPELRNILWQPLYLALGIDVVLFVLAGVADWSSEKTARRLLPGAIVIGILFYSLTLILEGNFLVFVIYEGAAMIAAMAIYSILALRQQLPGAATIAAGIGLTLIAAAIQASSLDFTAIWPFDHNGLFHLVQMPALLTIGCGLGIMLRSGP
jgi:hypothetical protein